MDASNSSFETSESYAAAVTTTSEEAKEEDEILKKRILSHPLYGMLVEAHLDCLKAVGVGDMDQELITHEVQTDIQSSSAMLSKTELDHFMEAYCYALSKLKDAIEEPLQESMAFIDCMYTQLMELTRMHHAPPDSPTMSSEEMSDAEGASDKDLNTTLRLKLVL